MTKEKQQQKQGQIALIQENKYWEKVWEIACISGNGSGADIDLEAFRDGAKELFDIKPKKNYFEEK